MFIEFFSPSIILPYSIGSYLFSLELSDSLYSLNSNSGKHKEPSNKGNKNTFTFFQTFLYQNLQLFYSFQ